MAEPPPDPDAGIARWQKVVGIVGLIVVVGLLLLLFGPGSGGHGPGRHAPGERQEQPVEAEDGAGHDRPQRDH